MISAIEKFRLRPALTEKIMNGKRRYNEWRCRNHPTSPPDGRGRSRTGRAVFLPPNDDPDKDRDAMGENNAQPERSKISDALKMRDEE